MEPFVGEIRSFGFNFAPKGWAQCNGQLLPLRQYTALFSILGVQYGGDGTNTFGLPNLIGQVAVGAGQLPGGENYQIGDKDGETGINLMASEMPAHTHTFNGGTAASPVTTLTNTPAANQSYISNTFVKNSATGGVPGRSFGPVSSAANVMLHPMCVGFTGGGQLHNNMMPYTTTNYCIALEGVFPQRP